MTTIEMARASHLDVYGLGKDRDKFVAVIERFAALVRADERDAVCDIVDYELDSNGHAEAIKIAIRARGEKP